MTAPAATDDSGEAQHETECECVLCALDHDFELPQELVYAAHGRELVIFAGAGISTEVPSVFPETVMQTAAARLGLKKNHELSFPEVIQQFEDKFGRRTFVQMVKAKFDYVDSFWGLRYNARRFHKELATMPYLQDIVTTNWDTYFEEECAATPFVTGADIALWKMAGRRVLKIHGSMGNLGSIIATEKDYKKSLRDLRRGVLGGLLTELLTTRTIVFIGYSLKDWNFRRLYKQLRKDMGDYSERAYFVSPFGADEADVKGLGLVPLQTSGVKFLRELKKANLGSCFLDDSSYDRVALYKDEIVEAEALAKTVPHKKYPAVLYCWSFHDGARDACSRIAIRKGSGEYSSRHYVRARLKTYEAAAERAWKQGRYWDHAYIEGYLAPLYIMIDDQPDPEEGDAYALFENAPFYFMYGSDSDMRTEEEFHDAVLASTRRAPKPRMAARHALRNLPEDMIMFHDPFIQGLGDENEYAEDEHS